MDSDEAVGANIQRYRTALGMSQAQLAEGMTRRGYPMQQQTILKVEKGTRPLKFAEALAMAECLKVDDVQDLSEADEGGRVKKAAMRRITAMCDDVLEQAERAIEADDKLEMMLKMLRDMQEHGVSRRLFPSAFQNPKFLWLAAASAEQVKELAKGKAGLAAQAADWEELALQDAAERAAKYPDEGDYV